jgi:hypothetical protein
VGIGAAFLAVNVARADDLKAAGSPPASEAPWFQQFTASAGLGEGVKTAPNQTNEKIISWAATPRWGLTLNVRDADRTKTAGRDEAAFGAFYHFTPRLRVGGEVSMVSSPLASTGSLGADGDKSASVKLESAFKF